MMNRLWQDKETVAEIMISIILRIGEGDKMIGL